MPNDPLFLALAASMALAAAAIVLLSMRRRRVRDASRAALNAAVLRQRLTELEQEHARGLISADEFAAVQDDLRRRVLAEAVDDAPSTRPASAQRRLPVLTAAVALPVLALPIYLVAGSPHLLGERPVEAMTAEEPADGAAPSTPAAPAAPGAIPPAMLAQLEAHVATQPKDARAWVMLARARMDAGQFAPAAAAYQRAIDAQVKVARDPGVWCEYADAVGMSQGGSLAGKPRELIDKALSLDADAGCGLEMAGSVAVEARDFRAAQQYWTRLLAQLPEGSVQHVQLSTALERITQQARFALPSN